MTINYDSNFLAGRNDTIVVEADEFDRSFLRLAPDIAVVTAVDSDHLDIYGSVEEVAAGFIQFCTNVKPGGRLLMKHGLTIAEGLGSRVSSTYALDNEAAGCFARNVRIDTTASRFDWCSADETITDLALHYLGQHNIENALAAIRVARWLGIEPVPIRQAIGSFRGLKRRFEYIIKRDDLVYIDDYAHHPREITALLTAVRTLYPSKRITVVFQPHLYSRTRDLAREFGTSLDAADEVILLDIYPARERPIEGISARTILNEMTLGNKSLMTKSTLLDRLAGDPPEVLLTVGAGDIDRLVQPAKNLLTT
jgi:UDP-N-acetylmuramate--alanine ligase